VIKNEDLYHQEFVDIATEGNKLTAKPEYGFQFLYDMMHG